MGLLEFLHSIRTIIQAMYEVPWAITSIESGSKHSPNTDHYEPDSTLAKQPPTKRRLNFATPTKVSVVLSSQS